MAERHETEHRSFEAPDEVREFRRDGVRGRPRRRDLASQGPRRLGVGCEPAVVADWFGASTYAKGG